MTSFKRIRSAILSKVLMPFKEFQRQLWIFRLKKTEEQLAISLEKRKQQVRDWQLPNMVEELAALAVREVKLETLVPEVVPGKALESLTHREIELVFYEMHLRDVGMTAGPELLPSGFGLPVKLPVSTY